MMLQLIDKIFIFNLTHNFNKHTQCKLYRNINKIFIVDKINIKSNINKITNDRI